MNAVRYHIGLDVGSTTVKAVVVDAESDLILWQDYQRHETRQTEKVLSFLKQILADLDPSPTSYRIFITGSGGALPGSLIGATFVQEVAAVSLAVERYFPEAGSVIELGGQDAKMIFYRKQNGSGRKKKVLTMNDKCAGGTGAVLDKISAKLGIPSEELCQQRYAGLHLHPVAGKCGVFAETDVNTLQKRGVNIQEIMASVFEGIVQQNLSVLTRGNTLLPQVVLLGGPNTFIRGMREAWEKAIPKIWQDRGIDFNPKEPIQNLIYVPENSLYFAALGSVFYGRDEDERLDRFVGLEKLKSYLLERKEAFKVESEVSQRFFQSDDEKNTFKNEYGLKKFYPVSPSSRRTQPVFLGIDGGSTSTKAVLLDKNRTLLAKAYRLSRGNPIQDTVDVISDIRKDLAERKVEVEIQGVGTTGYAKDTLREVLRADLSLVETVAHSKSARHYYPDVDVICDVGGQDIKVILLKNGVVKDFKLNTQCSAGNGYFLQSTVEGFGYKVEDFAELAFEAERYPEFSYGCAVFLQSAIVDFQRQGWSASEIMAGLARVLPKNIWLYVSQIPNLAQLGEKFVLQGGTQNNLAAVKAQVDFIRSRFHAEDGEPDIFVHRHAGECGAIGVAMECIEKKAEYGESSFIGLEALGDVNFRTTADDRTRCVFCKNNCLRTFIDIEIPGRAGIPAPPTTRVPLEEGRNRVIISTCEKGSVEDLKALRSIKGKMDEICRDHPNFAEVQRIAVWKHRSPEKISIRSKKKRDVSKLRIGIPRVLNLYSMNPFFSAYFESLGILPENLVYSDFTSEKLFRQGSSRGAIDPCYPSKLAISHVHNLMEADRKGTKLDYLFFPMVESLPGKLDFSAHTRACPTVTITPETVKAAFTKESHLFEDRKIKYLNPLLKFANLDVLGKQLYECFHSIFGFAPEENYQALQLGLEELDRFYKEDLQEPARKSLKELERKGEIGVVLLGRPYHVDQGINHEILNLLQKQGYTIFTQDSLPIDEETLLPLFGEDVRAGRIHSLREIQDVWKNSYSENTNRKIFAAKFVTRHPNLVGLELSSFKCGHDATVYSVIERILEASKTPLFAFKDIDENRPVGSIKIRVETIDYFLKDYQEKLQVGCRPQSQEAQVDIEIPESRQEEVERLRSLNV